MFSEREILGSLPWLRGRFSWCGVNGTISSPPGIERTRKCVVVLMNVYHSIMVDFRIIWIKFRFSKIKVFVVVVAYDTIEGDVEGSG